MEFEKVKTEGTRHEYKVILKASDIEDWIEKVVSKRAKTYKMQGFRPGHVPLDIVRKNIETAILPDVFGEMINEACQTIIKEIGATGIATSPTYRFEENYENGKDAKVMIFIEAVPDFELKEFNGTIEKIAPLIREEDIKAAQESLIKTIPILEKAERGYVIKPGDDVSYSAQCFVNGVPSKKKSFENSVFIPANLPENAGFLRDFIGKKIGESFDFYPDESEGIVYRFTIKSIKRALLDLSFEEYAKRRNFKSAKELKEVIIKALKNDVNKATFVYHKQQILNILAKEYNFDLPKSIVEQETKNVIARIRQEIERERAQGEATDEDLKKTDEDFALEYGDLIKKRVLLGYILNKFAKKYGITVSNEEIKNAIAIEASRNSAHTHDIIQYYTKHPAAVEYLRAEIVEMKVVTLLIDLAGGKETEKTKEEVEQLVDNILEQG
jgi:trigger factor